MYVRKYWHIHISMIPCTNLYANVHEPIRKCVHMYICMRGRIYICSCVHMYIHTRVYKYIFIYIYIYIGVSLYSYMCAYIYTFIHIMLSTPQNVPSKQKDNVKVSNPSIYNLKVAIVCNKKNWHSLQTKWACYDSWRNQRIKTSENWKIREIRNQRSTNRMYQWCRRKLLQVGGSVRFWCPLLRGWSALALPICIYIHT